MPGILQHPESADHSSASVADAVEACIGDETGEAEPQAHLSSMVHPHQETLNPEIVTVCQLDWDGLTDFPPFRSTLPTRPFIVYDQDGAPVDIEYLGMQDAKPEEPVLPARPVPGSFQQEVGVLGGLSLRKHNSRSGAKNSYAKALRQWESIREQAKENYAIRASQWMEAAKAVDTENSQRYQQCVEDQQAWLQEKKRYDRKCRKIRATVRCFRQAYNQKRPSAVQRYVVEVLSRSEYLDWFPDTSTVQYIPGEQSILVNMSVLHPDDSSVLSSAAHEKSGNVAHNEYYSDLVMETCVQALHEVVHSDSADAVQHVVVNGHVSVIDPYTGEDRDIVIASVQTTKKAYLELPVGELDVRTYFEQLGGRGTSATFPVLSEVEPYGARESARAEVLNS